jgi:hypothetical protein
VAVVEEGSGGSRGPSPKLTKWDRPEDDAPQHPVGAISRPSVATAQPSYDSSRLQKLTPFAMPVEAPAPKGSATQAGAATPYLGGANPADAPLSSTTGAYYAAAKVAAGGDPPQVEAEAKPVEPKEKTRRSYQMSWDEYNKLLPEQRRAVDFNTLLVQAREKDLKHQDSYQASETEKAAYEDEVTKMFGEGHGSETFAPETLAVLKQIDFKTSGTDDLDNFLSLKSSISAKELKDFQLQPDLASPQVADSKATADLRQVISPGGAGGLGTEERAAVYTQHLQESMSRTNTLLQTFKASAAADRNSYVEGFGGLLNEPNQALGYGTGEYDKYFQNAFEYLARDGFDDATRSEMLADLHKQLDPKQLEQFVAYADERTRKAGELGQPLGRTPDVVYLNPVDLRALLQLDKGGQ